MLYSNFTLLQKIKLMKFRAEQYRFKTNGIKNYSTDTFHLNF